jgi:hypothetical protein
VGGPSSFVGKASSSPLGLLSRGWGLSSSTAVVVVGGWLLLWMVVVNDDGGVVIVGSQGQGC